MKSSVLPFLVALASVSLFGCGGDADGDAQGADADDAAAPASVEEPRMEQGDRTDLDAFLTEYEEFVDQYCQLTEEFASANMTEMAELMDRMSAQAMKLAEFYTQAVAFQASASPEAQRRLEEMEEKAQACADKISG